MDDERLISDARAGDAGALEQLLNRFKKMVRLKAGAYFMAGGDRDDIIQEGMIGLFKAVRDFNPKKNDNFAVFADMCVSRQILSAVKASSRQKHKPLNTSLPINTPFEMEKNMTAKNSDDDPETLFLTREAFDGIGSFLLEHLSALEYRVMMFKLQNMRPSEIAAKVNRDIKSVNNALRRARKKMEALDIPL